MEVQTFPLLEVQLKLIGREAEQLTRMAIGRGISTTALIQKAIQELLEKSSDEEQDWQALGISAFEADWDNAEDAIYDDWRKHYGVEEG